MTTDPTLPQALRNLAYDGTARTHYDGCWQTHIKCAAVYAADVIEGLQERVRVLEEEFGLDE